VRSNILGGEAQRRYASVMKHSILILPFLSTLLGLSACYGVPVEPVPYEDTREIPPDARPSPLGLKKVVLAIPRGETIGSTSPRGLGFLCRGPYGMVTRSVITGHMEKPSMREAFYDTMESQGYDVTGSPGLMFDEDDDEARTIYAVGARITDIKMDVCQRVTLLFSYDLGYTGEASMEVEWTVYDRLKRETVYKTMTRGYSRMDLPNYEAIGLMLDDSFAAAAHNLGADERFNNLVVRGAVPPTTRKYDHDPVFGIATKFDPRETVALPQIARRTQSAAPDLDMLRRNAVMIGTGAGHGSGFFIGDKGYILTNDHVVGDADRVRVVTAGGRHKLVGEVLRRDAARDVALIRIEDMPQDFHPVLLPVRRDIPRVGEDVYAIGAPFSEKDLQDTVTKGIVSAFRPDDRWDRQSFIQADVTIHPGNSGGPLLDAHGNIIGLSVAGYADENGNSLSGLNLFIPIGDALDRLDIGTGDTDQSPVNLVP
jgi:S1-C subfamily serine protease